VSDPKETVRRGSGKIARLKVLDFSADRSLAISGFGSRAASAVPLTLPAGDAHVVCLRLGAGGLLGRHPASVDQLFVVVDGAGWAKGADGERIPVSAGSTSRAATAASPRSWSSRRGSFRTFAMADQIRKVGVVGLGTMGAGIAQVSVQAGYDTVGREVSAALGERGKATVDRYLTHGVEKGRLTQEEKDAAIGRLALTTELADLADCDLVIEAVLEELPLKREVFAGLDQVTRPEAILATNTSALSVAEIAEATERPERVVGMHFFNPAPVLPLVEIVRAPRSADDAVRAAYDWAEGAGKQPVTCNDTPGFIVNRILIPLLNDCVRVLDEAGVAPEDLDKAMTNGAGWPLGPCALVDLVGIDVHIHASEALYEKLGEERMAPPERLLQLQQKGRLGRKTGAGFFEY